ncbi:MAG TPA: 50S ribosomal protein L35 [Solirubrobacteraceae bacterium]|nr:50S ribosomal protein L35 [Solirubrobacteraceae bacterium]
MPKMKTHSGAKKRFKVTATGKVRGRHAFTSHILEKKSPKHKRQLATQAILSADDAPRVKRLLTGKGARTGASPRSRSVTETVARMPAGGDVG